MSHPLDSLIDEILANASRDGAFDNLPGQGKPLKDLHNPKDPTLDRLMKESKAKPPVVVFKQKIATAQRELAVLTDPVARKAKMKELADLQMRLAMELEAFHRYG